MRIQGKTWRIVTMSPYVTKDVAADLYMLAITDEDGTIDNYVMSGRPMTYRVYMSLAECRNGINAVKRKYRGKILKPVRILTGEFVEEGAE